MWILRGYYVVNMWILLTQINVDSMWLLGGYYVVIMWLLWDYYVDVTPID